MREGALPDFPVRGHWLLGIIGGGQIHNETNKDPEIVEHLFLYDLLGYATYHDQLSCPSLAVADAIARRLQLWEERYAEKLRAFTAGGVSAGHATECHLFLGGSRPKGSALVTLSWKSGLPHNLPKRRPSLKT